jgi:nucleoside-diphosphate-sugar epimerase
MGESPQSSGAKLSAWLEGPRRGVAITGASGWVGRALVRAALGAGCETLRLFGSKAGAVEVASRSLPLESLHNCAPLGEGEWIFVHLAVAGADRFPDPRARRQANEAMLADALVLAGTGNLRRFVCASSGAVYAPPQADPDKQAYNDLKRDQEQIVQTWAGKTGAPILLPRIFNLGGPFMNHAPRYALGGMIQQAQADGVIRIQARRPVLRSYVHVLEFARVALNLALDAADRITFDTAGAEIVEMADLAAAVGRALVLPDLVIDRPPLEAGEEDRYVGDGTLYRAALGAPPTDLDAIIRDTAAWLGANAD